MMLDIPDVLSDSTWEKAYPIFKRLISDDMTKEQKAIAKWNILQVILAYEEDDSLEELAKNDSICYSNRLDYEKWFEDYKNDINPYRLKSVGKQEKFDLLTKVIAATDALGKAPYDDKKTMAAVLEATEKLEKRFLDHEK